MYENDILKQKLAWIEITMLNSRDIILGRMVEEIRRDVHSESCKKLAEEYYRFVPDPAPNEHSVELKDYQLYFRIAAKYRHLCAVYDTRKWALCSDVDYIIEKLKEHFPNA